jgi:hypothetical protein
MRQNVQFLWFRQLFSRNVVHGMILVVLFILECSILQSMPPPRSWGGWFESGIPWSSGCVPKPSAVCRWKVLTPKLRGDLGIKFVLYGFKLNPNDPNEPNTDTSPYVNIELLEPSSEKNEKLTIPVDMEFPFEASEALGTTKKIVSLKGEYKIDYSKSMYGTIVGVPVRLEEFSAPISCALIQDGNFANVTTSGSDISSTSTPWKPGALTPQWGGVGSDCDGIGGYAQMWGNNTVGESMIQTLGGGGIIKGQRYNLSFCARLRASQNSLNPNHVRVRVIAYNTTMPGRTTLPTATATLIYETPDITSTSWQSYSSCSWIADKNYTSIEVLPVNNSVLNNGDYVSWAQIDNMQMCQVNACDGLDFKIYPDLGIKDKCCYKVDLNLQTCMSNLKGMRIKTPNGVTIASATAPTPWIQSGLTANSVIWNTPTTNAPLSVLGGTLCLNAINSTPFFVTIEWLDKNDSVFCRTERKLVCPPPCVEIEKVKSITCIGYNDKGYPQYNYCLEVINNGSANQTAILTTNSGVLTPSTMTLAIGPNLVCGIYSANNTTPPASITINLATANGTCRDSIAIKLPTDCPPRQCMAIERVSLKCLATSQSGVTTYEYNWLLTNQSGVTPNTVTVTSSGGVETIYNNVTLASQITGILQNATPINDSICLTFTLRNIEKVVICTKSICLPAPKCSNCCDNFIKGVRVNSIVRTGINANGDNISMNMTFAPNRPIRSMTATIVSASRRRTSPFIGVWERIYGDIGGATAIASPNGPGLRYYGGIAPSTSFVVPTLKTREVEWGTNYSGTTGTFSTTIGLLFPAPYPGTPFKPSVDELDYFVRIAMVDINCVKCDTLIRVTLKRKSSPWNTFQTGATGIVRRTKIHKSEDILGATTNPNDPVQLTMSTKDKGVLTIQLPVDNTSTSEEKITVIGVGFKPEEIVDISEFTPITSNFTSVPNQDTLYCAGQLKEGGTASFNVLFNNPPFNRWENTVIVKYQIGTEPDTLTDYVTVVASVPVESLGGDRFEEVSDKTMKPRTYALSFTNANKSNRSIANVELRMPNGLKLLAIGSGLGDTVLLETIGIFKDDKTKLESFVIPMQNGASQQKAELNAGENVKPIYVTVAGTGFDISFTTKDADGVVLSEGTINLTIPLSIKNDNGDGARTGETILLDVYPNPVINSATINLGLQNNEVLNVVVTDLEGKEITTILSEAALQNGNHAFVLNTEMYSSGSYLIIVRNREGRMVSTQLKVVK